MSQRLTNPLSWGAQQLITDGFVLKRANGASDQAVRAAKSYLATVATHAHHELLANAIQYTAERVEQFVIGEDEEVCPGEFGGRAVRDLEAAEVVGPYAGPIMRLQEAEEKFGPRCHNYCWSIPNSDLVVVGLGYDPAAGNLLASINDPTGFIIRPTTTPHRGRPPRAKANLDAVILWWDNVPWVIYVCKEKVKKGDQLFIEYGNPVWRRELGKKAVTAVAEDDQSGVEEESESESSTLAVMCTIAGCQNRAIHGLQKNQWYFCEAHRCRECTDGVARRIETSRAPHCRSCRRQKAASQRKRAAEDEPVSDAAPPPPPKRLKKAAAAAPAPPPPPPAQPLPRPIIIPRQNLGEELTKLGLPVPVVTRILQAGATSRPLLRFYCELPEFATLLRVQQLAIRYLMSAAPDELQ